MLHNYTDHIYPGDRLCLLYSVTHWPLGDSAVIMNYCKISNIRCTKWQNLNNSISNIRCTKWQNLKDSHPVLQFAQSIETRCQVDNEDVVGAALTGDLSDQQSYCLLWCCLYWRVDGNHFQTHIKDRYVLWNCPHVNATRPQWWLVSIGSGNGLVPSAITSANVNIDLGQHWLAYWLVAWQHQAITWTNVDLSSEIFIIKIYLKFN